MSDNHISQERISQKLSPTSKANRKGKPIAIVCICAVFIALIVVILFILKSQNKPVARNVVVTPENVDEILEDLKGQKTQAGQYEVTMNSVWQFKDGSSASSNAYVENATSNTNDVYFDIVRSDTGETILKSPTIPVGSHLENITLDTDLEAGDYKCVMTYHLLDESSQPISKLNINLSIHVEN